MIVFVHGLWLTGVESAWLRHRITSELQGESCAFHYRSVTDTVGAAIESLRAFILKLGVESVHLVGHSLGGILILRLLEHHADLPPGRVVLLGPPIAGSSVARGLSRWRWGATAIGHMAGEELLRDHRRKWAGTRDLGIIAGSQPLGLGRIVVELPHPHDGTIAVSETCLEGMADHIVLPVSHTGMLFSAQVAHQTAYFLQHGRFSADARE